MTEYEMLNKVNALVNHIMCMYENRSRRAYETQTPTYFMGCFEAAYQFAYGVIENENIQDAIDLLNDDIRYYANDTSAYMHGYVKVAATIVKVMVQLERQFKHEYGIKSVWSLYNFNDIASAIK